MDIGNFFGKLVGNIERTVLDPSTLITDNVYKIEHSLAKASNDMSKTIGNNLKEISGSNDRGLKGVMNSTINNINPMVMMVGGIAAVAILIVVVKV